MLYAFSLLASGLWIYTAYVAHHVELIFMMLAAVVMLVLNTAVEHRNRNPYWAVTLLTLALAIYLSQRSLHYFHILDEFLCILTGATAMFGWVTALFLFLRRPR